MWIALRHQRVMPNEDGSITLLHWSYERRYIAMALGLTIPSALLLGAYQVIE